VNLRAKTPLPDWFVRLAGFIQSPRAQSALFLAGVLVIGAFLLLTRLDDAYLWEDEAETALVSRQLLRYGLPLGADGRHLFNQTDLTSESFNKNYLWVWHSWLQFALTAVSFAVLGETTFAARLPFVLAGLATLGFFYPFVSRWLGDKRVARVATVLLLLCVPFMLLVRTCRYYTLAAFFTLTTIDAYLHLRAGKPWALAYFVLSATLYYHGHHAAFIPTMAALSLHLALTSRRDRKALYRFAVALMLVAVLVLPWANFMQVWMHAQPVNLVLSASHLAQYFLYITVWIFPLTLAALLFIAWMRRSKRTGLALSQPQAAFCELASLVIVVNILGYAASAFFDAVFFRHVTQLIPLLLAMLAIVVVLIMDQNRFAGYSVLLVLLVSNVLHMVPYSLPGIRHIRWSDLRPGTSTLLIIDNLWAKAHRLRSELLMYAQELTHSYEGPTEGLAQYLSTHAQPGDRVLANYEELPLIFYTDLRILGGLQGHGLTKSLEPEWIIDRRSAPYRDVLAKIIAAGSYERIELPYPDIRWENRPQPGMHNYLTVHNAPRVLLYRRSGDGSD